MGGCLQEHFKKVLKQAGDCAEQVFFASTIQAGRKVVMPMQTGQTVEITAQDAVRHPVELSRSNLSCVSYIPLHIYSFKKPSPVAMVPEEGNSNTSCF